MFAQPIPPRLTLSILCLTVGLLAACGEQLEPNGCVDCGDSLDAPPQSEDTSSTLDDVLDACLEVDSTEVTFTDPMLEEANLETLTVENCGARPLTLRAPSLTDDTDLAWSLRLNADQRDGLVLEPGASTRIVVELTPTRLEPVEGTLVIEADDGTQRTVALRMTRAFLNHCPQPVAHAEAGMPETSVTVVAGTVLKLDGSDSTDPDGDELIEYQWSIVAAPTGFLSTFVNDRGVDTEIQLTHVGDYVFELDVTDEHGLAACEPARVHVYAQPADGLVVELTWETPSDPDETDTCQGCGTDLGLHMLSPAPGAYWTERRNNGTEGDCYFNNDNPNWGNPIEDVDDPELDRDDTDGAGPERITMEQPARTDGVGIGSYTQPYQIGVYYYDDWQFEPPVYATVRIYLNGDPIPAATWPSDDVRGQALRRAEPLPAGGGDFWLAGSIDWGADGGTAHEIDTVHVGFPQ